MEVLKSAVAALALLWLPVCAFAAPAAAVRDVSYRNGNLEITARLYLPPETVAVPVAAGSQAPVKRAVPPTENSPR